MKPPPKKPKIIEDVHAEDHQSFLLKLKEQLRATKSSTTTQGKGGLAINTDAAPAPAGGEGNREADVRNFYNRLLTTPRTAV